MPSTYKIYINSFNNYEDCIHELLKIIQTKPDHPEIEININTNIKEFDFSLVGHFILIKKLEPNIKIKLILNKNTFEDNSEENNILWKIRQTMVHAYFTSKINVFSIIDANGKVIDINSEQRRESNWFVFSTEFLPIVLIDEENYTIIFEKPMTLLNLKRNEKLNIKSEEELYGYCRNLLIKLKNKKNYFQILAQLAFYKSLQSLRSLRYYFLSEENVLNINLCIDNIYVGNVQDDIKKNYYWRIVLEIFDELKTKPPIYAILFCALTSSKGFIVKEIDNNNIDNIANKLLALWLFAKELIYGLNELAKNIVEHSSTREGILSGHIDSNCELVINIFDYGEKGIVNTLKDTTSQAYKLSKDNSISRQIYQDDYEILCSDKFQFQYLFDLNNVQLLNQQTKRATIHLGLLILSKLIKDNEGRLFVCSADFERYDSYPEKKNVYSDIKFGTKYEIILPTIRTKKSHYNQIISPVSQNAEDTLSIVKMISYGDNPLINIKIRKINSTTRSFDQSIWNDFEEQLLLAKSDEINANTNIISVSFNELDGVINASQIFRFLGCWELKYPTQNIILYDINIELYFELLEINMAFISVTKDLHYWNSNAITLFYSFFKIPKSNQKFYFTDALWGKKRDDFIHINALIQKNNFNALSYHPGFSKKDCDPSEGINSIFFYKGKTLLPFDLLIKDEANTSIFEHNAKALLCNDLKDYNVKKNVDISPIISIKEQILGLPGFKISNSHFRLGSKIHITDFYYAKRFFQNSFYASRFAFVIAQYIIHQFPFKNEFNELTLIGYGLYSELLMSLIVRYLIEYCDKKKIKPKINHNLFTDTTDMKLVKSYEKIHKNIIIIVPIASTFSTALKIEDKFRKSNINILNPYINILAMCAVGQQCKR